MQYVIGIDGGGTKTHSILTDENGEIKFECFGGPSNFLMLGTEVVSETIHSLIAQSIKENNLQQTDIVQVLLGTTGAGRRSDAERLENDFKVYLEKNHLPQYNLVVESDARIALEGAFSGKPGSILIAGTGSIMFGKDSNEVVYRVGGFGRFIGDEGSGYSIGKKGLVAVAKCFDGRGRQTLLKELLLERCNIESPELLITEIYKNNFDLASFAPIVLEAASKGDPVAVSIVEQESDELIFHIKAMRNKISEKPLYVSLIGGILSNENILSQKFIEKTIIEFDDVVIKEKDFSPAYGAVIMALKKLN
jgi:N-acetylglucosamine kinase-like BadF-type ATPase